MYPRFLLSIIIVLLIFSAGAGSWWLLAFLPAYAVSGISQYTSLDSLFWVSVLTAGCFPWLFLWAMRQETYRTASRISLQLQNSPDTANILGKATLGILNTYVTSSSVIALLVWISIRDSSTPLIAIAFFSLITNWLILPCLIFISHAVMQNVREILKNNASSASASN
jgi:hypothetical protein